MTEIEEVVETDFGANGSVNETAAAQNEVETNETVPAEERCNNICSLMEGLEVDETEKLAKSLMEGLEVDEKDESAKSRTECIGVNGKEKSTNSLMHDLEVDEKEKSANSLMGCIPADEKEKSTNLLMKCIGVDENKKSVRSLMQDLEVEEKEKSANSLLECIGVDEKKENSLTECLEVDEKEKSSNSLMECLEVDEKEKSVNKTEVADKKIEPDEACADPGENQYAKFVESENVRKDQGKKSAKFVELVSSDGDSFQLERECALISPIFRMILEAPRENQEQKENKIVLNNMRSEILNCVCGYLRFKQHVLITGDTSKAFYVNPKISIELMIAADYLNI